MFPYHLHIIHRNRDKNPMTTLDNPFQKTLMVRAYFSCLFTYMLFFLPLCLHVSFPSFFLAFYFSFLFTCILNFCSSFFCALIYCSFFFYASRENLVIPNSCPTSHTYNYLFIIFFIVYNTRYM
jgi:hypothetical protein